jgi:hypothetical protein
MMKILQKIWDWLIRLVCFGFEEPESKAIDESRLVEDYKKRMNDFRAAAQAVIADHYRCKMLLKNEYVKLEEARAADLADPDSTIAHNRFIISQDRVEYLHKQVIDTGKEANRALDMLEKLENDLSNVTMKLHDAQIAKRAAEFRLAAANWRMESELGLNKELNALSKMQEEARHTERKAELTQQTNDVLSDEPREKNLEE